jgi:hypothetical protein
MLSLQQHVRSSVPSDRRAGPSPWTPGPEPRWLRFLPAPRRRPRLLHFLLHLLLVPALELLAALLSARQRLAPPRRSWSWSWRLPLLQAPMGPPRHHRRAQSQTPAAHSARSWVPCCYQQSTHGCHYGQRHATAKGNTRAVCGVRRGEMIVGSVIALPL